MAGYKIKSHEGFVLKVELNNKSVD